MEEDIIDGFRTKFLSHVLPGESNAELLQIAARRQMINPNLSSDEAMAEVVLQCRQDNSQAPLNTANVKPYETQQIKKQKAELLAQVSKNTPNDTS